MFDKPRPGERKADELLPALEQLVADARSTSWHSAYGRALDDDLAISERNLLALEEDPKSEQEIAYGNLAGLMLMWITGGWTDSEALQAAHQVLHGRDDDPLKAKVHDLARRIETGDITWNEFARITKKALIPRAQPIPSASPPGAIPLKSAKATLAEMLTEAVGPGEPPTLAQAWEVFKAFAVRPVAAASPMSVEHDACLAQWGRDGRHFEWDLVRQFAINDGDGDYDHMEQLHLTLLFDSATEPFASIAPADVWSGPNFNDWVREVESLDAYTAVAAAHSVKSRLEHYRV